MNLIELIASEDEEWAIATYADEEGRSLQVSITEEGVIFDAFNQGEEEVGTVGRMAAEWYSHVVRPESRPEPLLKLRVGAAALREWIEEVGSDDEIQALSELADEALEDALRGAVHAEDLVTLIYNRAATDLAVRHGAIA